MKLLVVVLCLLSERFLIHSASYQRFSWFGKYSQYIKNVLDKNQFIANPWLLFVAILTPIILCTSVIYFLLSSVLFGFVGLIISVVIFFYCLGPQNPFYPLSLNDSENQSDVAVASYFANVNNQLFSVLFWYLILGPIAALTYRLISLCREVQAISFQANQVADILEWLPARITVLLFLLVGNFQKGSGPFLHYLLAGPDLNSKMLAECGLGAVRSSNTSDEISMSAAETLVEHASVVLLVFLALLTLVAWM